MSAPKGRQVNTPTGGKEQPSHTAPRAQERPESKVSALEDRTLVCNLSSHRDSRATSPFVSEGQLVPSCEDPEDPRSGMCPQTTRRSCHGVPPLPPTSTPKGRSLYQKSWTDSSREAHGGHVAGQERRRTEDSGRREMGS